MHQRHTAERFARSVWRVCRKTGLSGIRDPEDRTNLRSVASAESLKLRILRYRLTFNEQIRDNV